MGACMKIIAEQDIPIRCDSLKCTGAAHYICVVKTDPRYVRLYCSQHTAELLQGIVKVMADDEKLSDYVSTEHLMEGAIISV